MNHATFVHPSHRDGEFTFAPAPAKWAPCSPMEDFLLTFGTFALAMVAPVSLAIWMLLP